MLLSFRDLRHFRVAANDAAAGGVDDLLFDDRTWQLRYLVVETGGWLRAHPVLLDPELIDRIESEERAVHVAVDKQRLADSPPIESHPPVTRHAETTMRAYFGLPPLNHPTGATVDVWGQPVEKEPHDPVTLERREMEAQARGAHLRSARTLVGYGVEGHGAHLGTVDDVLIDEAPPWHLRHLVVETGGWLTGKRRLVATAWVGAISHDACHVRVDLTRERMAEAPDFDTAADIDHGAERWLFRHYGFSPKR